MHARHLLLMLPAALSACTLGPDFHHPAAPAGAGYTAGAQPQVTAAASGAGGEAQRFLGATAVPNRWWELFQCDALNALVTEALAHNPTVLEARARLREAQQDLTAQERGTLYPALDAQLGVTRQKLDPAAFGIPNIPAEPPFTLYNAQVNVSYTLDLFGANRRMLEGAQAQSDYQAFETQAAELTLAANVAAAAIRQADLQAQIEYTEQLLEAQSRELAITEERYQLGGVSLQDLQSGRSQLEQLRASLPVLRAQRQEVDHQLAIYTGKSPAEAAVPRFTLAQLHLPADLPVTLPSQLVRQRPDVRASEELWHQAGANVGVATANLFPNLTISGYAGSDRTNASQLADSLNVWSIGAKLLQPIFHAGELGARKRSAVAAYDAAAQAYEQTVLSSLQQVADCLRVLESDAQTLQARSAAAQHLSDSYDIATQRFALGGVSELSMLDVRRQHLQAQLDRSRAEAQRFTDTAALLHALAGAV